MAKKTNGMDSDPAMSTDSDSDSSEDESNMLEERARQIELELSNNKYLYDLHTELVGIYEKLGDLIPLREAYNRFASFFPLTEKLWLKLIEIEKILAETEEDTARILELFKRATTDYLSVKLWLEYVQFAMGKCSLEETHAILERALSAAGLHFTDGSLLWDTLRELELAQLSLNTDESSEEYGKQLRKLVDAYRRQLGVPLINIQDTHEEWLSFLEQIGEGKLDSKVVEVNYEKSLQLVETYKPFEDRLLLVSTDEELGDIFREYIKIVKDPSLVLCLYERHIERVCLQPHVWISYINYAMKLGAITLQITERALRNVTWSETLWCLRLRVLEMHDEGVDKVQGCFEQGLSMLSTNLDVWMYYIAYTRRNKQDALMKLLDYAGEQQIYDPTLKLKRYHARICGTKGNVERGRELWAEILLQPEAKKCSQFWLEFVNYELRFGNVQNARAVFKRAITCHTDYPGVIAEAYVVFEQEHGTLEDELKCSEKVQKIASTPVQIQNPIEVNNSKRPLDDKVEKSAKKHKIAEQPRVVKNQGAPSNLIADSAVFVSNLHPYVSSAQLSDLFPSGKVTLATNAKGGSRCFAYVQFKTAEEAASTLQRDREVVDGRPMFISKCAAVEERQAAFKFAQTVEKNKLFVRGLPIRHSQEDVEKLFAPYKCTAVRLVLHKSGQSKGLAYVEFACEEDAQEAIKALDKSEVEGFTIGVAISAPPPKMRKEASGSSDQFEQPQRHARSRLQVPLIPRAALKSSTPAAVAAPSAEGGGGAKKSNNDFRNMLLKK